MKYVAENPCPLWCFTVCTLREIISRRNIVFLQYHPMKSAPFVKLLKNPGILGPWFCEIGFFVVFGNVEVCYFVSCPKSECTSKLVCQSALYLWSQFPNSPFPKWRQPFIKFNESNEPGNHWSMNWARLKYSVCYLWLSGSAVRHWPFRKAVI